LLAAAAALACLTPLALPLTLSLLALNLLSLLALPLGKRRRSQQSDKREH
jgi:membrane protein implicated in regulation of membrane protease activity